MVPSLVCNLTRTSLAPAFTFTTPSGKLLNTQSPPVAVVLPSSLAPPISTVNGVSAFREE